MESTCAVAYSYESVYVMVDPIPPKLRAHDGIEQQTAKDNAIIDT